MKKIFAFAVLSGMLFATSSCNRKQCPAYGSTQPQVEQPAVHKV